MRQKLPPEFDDSAGAPRNPEGIPILRTAGSPGPCAFGGPGARDHVPDANVLVPGHRGVGAALAALDERREAVAPAAEAHGLAGLRGKKVRRVFTA